jgi:hypothetical protein
MDRQKQLWRVGVCPVSSLNAGKMLIINPDPFNFAVS